MKGILKSKNFIMFGIALMAAFCLSKFAMPTVRAAQSTGSVSVAYEVEGAEFAIYKIGVVNGTDIELTGDYAKYPVDMKSANAAQTLENYIRRDSLKPLATAKTGQDKTVTFDNLEYAAYLFCGNTVTVDNMRYTAVPSLVSVPAIDEGSVTTDISIQSKYEKEEIPDTTDVAVVIVWKDTGFENGRPSKLAIYLLRNDEVYDEVVLSDENNWSHTWEDLDGNYEWSIVEAVETEGYEVTTEKDGRTYIIIKVKDGEEVPPTTPNTPNTPNAPTTPTTPDEPQNAPALTPSKGTVEGQLPQTGQLWWPVYTLICVGLLFIIIGVLCKRRNYQ